LENNEKGCLYSTGQMNVRACYRYPLT
jgi:hypothetical protein